MPTHLGEVKGRNDHLFSQQNWLDLKHGHTSTQFEDGWIFERSCYFITVHDGLLITVLCIWKVR